LRIPYRCPTAASCSRFWTPAGYIHDLPRAKKLEDAWQNAAEALLVVVNQNGPTMFARIGMMKALYPQGERVFNPDRKCGRTSVARGLMKRLWRA
jgi:hypothetical protein